MRRQEISAVQIGLLYYSLFLPFWFNHGHARSNHNKQQGNCSSSCGDIRNISYPFRLKGAPQNCGDPRYELVCEDGNRTVLYLNPGRIKYKYYVKDIYYESQTIWLVDIGLANGVCNLTFPYYPLDDFDFDSDNEYFFSPRNQPNWATIMNCSLEIKDDDYTSIPCLSGNKAHLYVDTLGGFLVDELRRSCHIVSMVPVPYDLSNTRSLREIGRILGMGFQVSWSFQCRECRLSNRSCYVDDLSGSFIECGPKHAGVLQGILQSILLSILESIYSAFYVLYLLGLEHGTISLHMPTVLN